MPGNQLKNYNIIKKNYRNSRYISKIIKNLKFYQIGACATQQPHMGGDTKGLCKTCTRHVWRDSFSKFLAVYIYSPIPYYHSITRNALREKISFINLIRRYTILKMYVNRKKRGKKIPSTANNHRKDLQRNDPR